MRRVPSLICALCNQARKSVEILGARDHLLKPLNIFVTLQITILGRPLCCFLSAQRTWLATCQLGGYLMIVF